MGHADFIVHSRLCLPQEDTIMQDIRLCQPYFSVAIYIRLFDSLHDHEIMKDCDQKIMNSPPWSDHATLIWSWSFGHTGTSCMYITIDISWCAYITYTENRLTKNLGGGRKPIPPPYVWLSSLVKLLHSATNKSMDYFTAFCHK